MKSFFKFFLAAFLALIAFTLVGFGMLSIMVSLVSKTDKTEIKPRSVLYIDVEQQFKDKKADNTLAKLTGDKDIYAVSLHEAVELIHYAKSDSLIKGIYLKCNGNSNGFGSSEELRNAILDFKESRKFVIAYGEIISQKAYYVAATADKIYGNPKGMMEWSGFSSQLYFFKNALKKLEIEPQIFYDGKFKSATEPFREEKMTDANRLQTTVWLGDIYHHFLQGISEQRNVDTVTLSRYASDFSIQTPADAEKYGLLDGLKYDDEVKAEIRKDLGIAENAKISFVPIGTYAQSVALKKYSTDRIAVVYAEGSIVDGKGRDGQIASDEYRNLIAKIRTDKHIKAVVLRVNSPGGSALASEIIWREITLAREKGLPVVVSMGDVAASGGYYISCAADSIFAQPNTITGSIGVFGIVPNMKNFFNNKLGVTFDRVNTNTYADFGSTVRPMSDFEKKVFQTFIDSIYLGFKTRVSDGRKRNLDYVDSIAQGRVWTGARAMEIGLVDKLGGLNDAIACAARMANLQEYSIREYPQPPTIWDMLKGNLGKSIKANMMREELGSEEFRIYKQMRDVREYMGVPQTRMPYDIFIE
ncbi:MAG: signal peptide peptidase SppA [Chitinophagaceae bacterium]|nr:signal peptide peptidase SppA [Chitinophagaceae bacterium]